MTYVKRAGVGERQVLVFRPPEVLEGDIIDKPVANIRTGPALKPRPVLAVQHPDILDEDIPDETLLARILANRTHGLAMGTITVHRVDVEVGGVRLGREAIVSDVDPAVGYCELVNVV